MAALGGLVIHQWALPLQLLLFLLLLHVGRWPVQLFASPTSQNPRLTSTNYPSLQFESHFNHSGMHVTSALSVFPVSFSSEAVVGICPSSFVSYLRFLQPTYVTIYATTVLSNCCTITFIDHSSECLHTRVISLTERVPTEAYRIILRPRSPGTTETHKSVDVARKLWLKQHIWIWYWCSLHQILLHIVMPSESHTS